MNYRIFLLMGLFLVIGVLLHVVAAQPLSLDGQNAIQYYTAAPSASVSLTTSNTNDIIVLLVGQESAASIPITVNSVSGGGLAWNRRTIVNEVNTDPTNGIYALQDDEIWWAYSPGILSSANIVVTLNGIVDDGVLTIFGVTGANTISPFDPNPALPASLMALASPEPSEVSVTTSNPNDFIFAFYGDPSAFVPSGATPAGMNSIETLTNSAGTFWQWDSSEYEIVNTIQTAQTIGWASNAQQYFIELGDAIQSGGPSSTSTTSTSTTTSTTTSTSSTTSIPSTTTSSSTTSSSTTTSTTSTSTSTTTIPPTSSTTTILMTSSTTTTSAPTTSILTTTAPTTTVPSSCSGTPIVHLSPNPATSRQNVNVVVSGLSNCNGVTVDVDNYKGCSPKNVLTSFVSGPTGGNVIITPQPLSGGYGQRPSGLYGYWVCVNNKRTQASEAILVVTKAKLWLLGMRK